LLSWIESMRIIHFVSAIYAPHKLDE